MKVDSTYRIQFNKNFTFKDFLENKDYFFPLHPSAVYASPVMEAVPGSTHGYDVTDPEKINPEIGTDAEFIELSNALKSEGIGWVQDIVPNHMAFHKNNPRLMDILEKGKESVYAGFFDIDFEHPALDGKLMIPVLGKPLAQCLQDHEIQAEWKNGKFYFRYFDYEFPIDPGSLHELIKLKSGSMPGVDDTLEAVNSDPGLAGRLLDKQHYLLAYWRDSGSIMNYRRFFTVNGLICINIDNDKVFDEYHAFIKKVLDRKMISGLRVDHIDGLKKPAYYLDKLRLLAGDDIYIITEKILGSGEELPVNLPIQGTSGYDYLATVNNLFTKTSNYKKLKQFYHELTGIREDVPEIIYTRKKNILAGSMEGELENLARMFDESGFITYSKEITRQSVKESIGEFLVLFPVYRLFSDSFPLTKNETEVIVNVFTEAIKRNPVLKSALTILENVFLEQKEFDEPKKDKALNFYLRCLQFTGPLMAKGVEDTVMYYYNCFIAHNEVGDDPGSEGISAEEYHKRMVAKRRYWPLSMNATSTHDTKRGEDVRARLNVISEIPDEWIRTVVEWQKINASAKALSGTVTAPDNNEEYFIYQTLAGTFPMDGKITDDYTGRITEYLGKALKEAKNHSNWLDPDKEYEKAVTAFTSRILQDSRFMKSFLPFQKKLAAYGIVNSLSQLVLKAASPGVPDFYQGTELWDLSLVDPDNRRPVDYRERYRILRELDELNVSDPENFFNLLKGNLFDGRLKFWMTYHLLRERENDPDLFLKGNYIPLATTGKYKGNVIAFARTKGPKWFIVIVPLYLASADKDMRFLKIHEFDWKDTSVTLPEFAPDAWTVFNGTRVKVDGKISLSTIMKFPCPVFLKSDNIPHTRFAGVLSHISSLPGEFGSGDLGETAYHFADILNRNGQSFWQILPFNPAGPGYGFSPYSSISAFAGNTMFLSPGQLVNSGYINENSLNLLPFDESNRVEFERAVNARTVLSDEAFTGFFCRNRPLDHARFEEFCEKEKYWLNDFALFNIIKRENGGEQWSEWPVKFRNRDEEALAKIQSEFDSEIMKDKLMQFLFQHQWIALKNYCNSLGIRIIGDISFYVNYDSVDVWAHPGLFSLDSKKNPVKVAGVPPDYFSSTGQLWNMPVYNWGRMKRDGYTWWLKRIRRNLDLSDIVRFDHFRAFSEYWEVPFGEKTAENGEWVAGPGYDFFRKVKTEFPGMPFIAEDLGTIDEKVYKLKDDFGLPGMVVLQFAFGDDVSRSGYAPHNHQYNSIVYPGTHDNNTIRGWFEKELSDKQMLAVIEYFGYPVSGETCNEDFIRMAYRSVAKVAIIPVQDLLGLDETARFNMPSTMENNWDWKMKKDDLEKLFSDKIRRMVRLYGRI